LSYIEIAGWVARLASGRKRRIVTLRLRRPSGLRPFGSLLTLLAGYQLLTTGAVAQTHDAEALLRAEYPVLTQRVGARQSADFVILIDASGSMKRFWGPVREALSSFVTAVPDGDYISIVLFGSRARYLTTPAPINAQSRQEIRRSLAGIPSPTDRDTDLGAGIESCLHELNRPGGATLKFVFFLTDFKHDPPPATTYPGRPDPEATPWAALARRRQNELQGRLIQAFALLLPLDEGVGRDLPVGRSVFPDLHEVPIRSEETLLAWFHRREAEVARDRLRAFVGDDIGKEALTIERVEVRAAPLGGASELVAWLKPRATQAVQLARLTDVQGEMTDATGALAGLAMDPAAPQQVDFPTGDARSLVIGRLRWPRTPFVRSAETGTLRVAVRGTQGLEPGQEITKLDLDAAPPVAASIETGVEVPRGLVPPWILLAVAAALAAALAGWLYHRRDQYLVGHLAVLDVAVRTFRPTDRRKEVVVGEVTTSDGIEVPGAAWKLWIRAFAPRGADGKPRGIYARMEHTTAKVTLGRKTTVLAREWHRIGRGSRIEIEDTGTSVTWN
jgi:hypothetical protein